MGQKSKYPPYYRVKFEIHPFLFGQYFVNVARFARCTVISWFSESCCPEIPLKITNWFPSSSWPRALNSINFSSMKDRSLILHLVLSEQKQCLQLPKEYWLQEETSCLRNCSLFWERLFIRCSTPFSRLLFYCVNLDISDYY